MNGDHQLYCRDIPVPCVVQFADWVVDGQVTSLSPDGALIEADFVPAEGDVIIVGFESDSGKVALQGKLTSRTLHSEREIKEGKSFGSFDIRFQESRELVRAQIESLLLHFEEVD